jgi:hypothetical protein
MPKDNSPVAKFRNGNVTAAVWKNPGTNETEFFSTTLQKSYKDGDEWKNTDSLNHGDLPNAVRALERAAAFIEAQ